MGIAFAPGRTFPHGAQGDFFYSTTHKFAAYHDGTEWTEVGQAVTTVVLAGTVAVGELLGYSSGWVRASKTAGGVIAPQFIALKAGVSGDVIPVTRRAIIPGSYTAGARVYLSTLGTITTTRSTTVADLRVDVGVAISAGEALVELKGLREVEVPIRLLGATSALTALDSGDFGGPTLDAQNEVAYLLAHIPENAVSLVKAVLCIAAEATAGTPTMDVTISSATTGAQWDAVAADTVSNAVREGSAPDEIFDLDISAGFNGTNIFRPGANIGIKCLQDDAGTDVSFVFGGTLTVLIAE